MRDPSPRFRKLSAYIPQEDEIRMSLTVKEAMTFAVHLKLGYNVSNEYKMKKVRDSEMCHNSVVYPLAPNMGAKLCCTDLLPVKGAFSGISSVSCCFQNYIKQFQML